MPEILHTTNQHELIQCAMLMSQSDPWIRLQMNYEKCLQSLEGDFKEVYVAKEAGRLLGFAVLQMKGVLSGYIQTLCIHPNFRKKGHGTRFLQFCEERIFKVSPNVFICFSSFNLSAGRLYEKLGYERIGELKDMMVKGESEILLRKTTGPRSEFIAKS